MLCDDEIDASESSVNFLNNASHPHTVATANSPIGEVGTARSTSHTYSWPERQAGLIEQLIGPEFIFLGFYRGYIYRYKQAILNDHICVPGESFVEFICTLKGREGSGARTKLMQWASKSAEKLGCGTIRLTVMGDTPASKERFERDGFEVCKSWTDPIAVFIMRFVFGIKENCYFEMEKPLGIDAGVAIHANAYGFTNDRIALSDSASSHDDLGSSLHDMAQHIIDNTRGLIHTARDFMYRSTSSIQQGNSGVPEYGNKYSAVFSPILRNCMSDSAHNDNIDISATAGTCGSFRSDIDTASDSSSDADILTYSLKVGAEKGKRKMDDSSVIVV